jgi:hypothetical protein
MTQLLIDTCPIKCDITEEAGRPGVYKVRGEFARSDRPTENKRHYREQLWKREIGRLSESLGRRRVLGELDHPQDGKTHLTRVSHIITGLEIRNGQIVGEAEIMDTPNGRILKALYDASAEVGVSSRGYGSVKTMSDGTLEVQEDFVLDTFDFVANPAQKGAYPKIVEELLKIPEDERMLTLESLKKDYPGLVEMMAKEMQSGMLTEDETRKRMERAVVEATDRTEARLREQFSVDLRRSMEKVQERAYERAHSDLSSDPAIAGSRTILEQITAILSPFVVPPDTKVMIQAKDDEIEQLKAKVAEGTIRDANAKAKIDEVTSLAKRLGFQLHMERLLKGNEDADTIIKVVGDLESFKSVNEVSERVGAVIKDLDEAKKKAKGKADADKADAAKKDAAMKESLDKLQAELTEARAAEKRALDTAKQAVELVEQAKVQIYMEGRISGMDDADTVRSLCESAKTNEDVDSIIKRHVDAKVQPRRIDEDEAARIRSRVAKGREADLDEEVRGGSKGNGSDEDASNPLAQYGFSKQAFEELVRTRG